MTASSLNVSDKDTTRANLGLTLASNDEVVSTVTPASFVTAWGDSLTQGTGVTPYPTTLASILGRSVNNEGVGGNTSTQIAIRQGGVSTTATISGGIIPASGGVTVSFPSGFEPVTSIGPNFGTSGTLSGIYGTVTFSSGTYTFTRLTSGSAVSVTSAQFVVDTGTLNNGIIIIWAGRNNIYSSAQVEQVKADISAMVSSLGSNKNYIILSVTNASTETSGTTIYNNIASLNSNLASTYSGHYLDIRSYLINHGLTDAGITANAQDITDIGNDTIPTSLHSDSIHFTTAGYTVIAQQVAKFIKNNFETEVKSNNILTSSNLTSIFASPMVIGTTRPNIGVFSSLKTSNSFYMPQATNTTGDTSGIIYMNSNRFIHAFNYGNNGTVTTAGNNTFIGINAGNLTMGQSATASNQASNNVGIGFSSLNSNRTGYQNVAIGSSALGTNTTGYSNIAIGSSALNLNTIGNGNVAVGDIALLRNTTGTNNIAIGSSSLSFNTSGIWNTAVGSSSLNSNTTGGGNSSFGFSSLNSNTTGGGNSSFGDFSASSNIDGSSNISFGDSAGRYIADGTTGNKTGDYNVFLGASTKALADNDQNEIVIGYNTIGIGSNTVSLGNTSIIKSILRGTINLSSYGAGTLSTDASGNITASSDERLKDIEGNFDNGGNALGKILNINPIKFKWNALSGYDMTTTYAGFSAQNIESVIPEAVGTDPRGYLTLSDRPILATVVNAIKEMNLKLEDISNLSIENSWRKSLISWFSNIENGITDLYAKVIHSDKVETKELCLDDLCVTKDQLKQMLINAGGVSNAQATAPTVTNEATLKAEEATGTPSTPKSETPDTTTPGTPAESATEATTNTTSSEPAVSTAVGITSESLTANTTAEPPSPETN